MLFWFGVLSGIAGMAWPMWLMLHRVEAAARVSRQVDNHRRALEADEGGQDEGNPARLPDARADSGAGMGSAK